MPRKRTLAPNSRQRESNANWRGGRSVASNGYVLIRVGTDHPLADVRGYAYEHRIIATQMIGRSLKSSEQIHHRNGNKTDNRPENLEVLGSFAEHRQKHRTVGFDRRVLGEENPNVPCACGCGTAFPKFDATGRPRRYVSGHNPMPSPATDAVLSALESGARANREIARATGLSDTVIRVTLSRLKKQGRVIHVKAGLWAKEGG